MHGYRVEYIDYLARYAEPFVDGLQHGWARQYGPTGKLILECRFKRGTGTDYWCDDDGRLSEEHPLVGGEPSGIERWWDPDQKRIYIETHWRAGQWHGPQRRWSGARLEKGFPSFFIWGERVSRRTYLSAAKRDLTLPPYSAMEDRPERTLPAEFLALKLRLRLRRRTKKAS